MLVKIAGDIKRDVGGRTFGADYLALACESRRVHRFELRLRVREAFIQMVDDLRLVRRGRSLFASSRVPRSAFFAPTSSE